MFHLWFWWIPGWPQVYISSNGGEVARIDRPKSNEMCEIGEPRSHIDKWKIKWLDVQFWNFSTMIDTYDI